MCMSLCEFMCTCEYSAPRGQERVLGFLEMELQRVVSFCVGAGNWTLVLCKSLTAISSPTTWLLAFLEEKVGKEPPDLWAHVGVTTSCWRASSYEGTETLSLS